MSSIAHEKYAAPSWQGNYDKFAVGPGDGTRWFGFTLDIGTDNLGAGDVWKFALLDSDTVVLGASLVTTDLDSHGTPTLTIDLGYASQDGSPADDDYFLANSTVGQAGGSADSSAARLFPTEDVFIQAKVEAAAATAAAGTVTCYLLLGNKNAN